MANVDLVVSKGFPHQLHLREGRFSETGRAYVLTACTALGVRLTDDPTVAEVLADMLKIAAKVAPT